MCLFALRVTCSTHEPREPGSDTLCFQSSCCAGQWSLCIPGLDSEGADGCCSFAVPPSSVYS